MRATNLIDATTLSQPVTIDRAERQTYSTITLGVQKPKYPVLKRKFVQ